MRKVLTYILVIAALGLVIYALSHKTKFGYENESNTAQTEAIPEVKPGTAMLGSWNINLEIADTEAKREQGLSDRESLDEETGMLFVFDEPSSPGFWMKDMKFPIDIVWLNKDKEIVEVLPNLKPESYPEIYEPLEPVQYVIEINAGAGERHGLNIGDKLILK